MCLILVKPICYFARWIEDVGLPEDRNVYQVVLRQISNRFKKRRVN